MNRYTSTWVLLGILTLACIAATVAWHPAFRWQLLLAVLVCTLGGWFGGIAYLLRSQYKTKVLKKSR